MKFSATPTPPTATSQQHQPPSSDLLLLSLHSPPRPLSAATSKSSLRLPLQPADSFQPGPPISQWSGHHSQPPQAPTSATNTRLDSSVGYEQLQQHQSAAASGADADADASSSKQIKRNASLISFKSIDFNLKNIYTNMKHKSREAVAATGAQTAASGASGQGPGSASGGSKNDTTSSSKTSISRTPYVRVETVDYDESHENLLLMGHHHHHQHSGQRPRHGSFDKSPSGSQYLSAQASSRSQATSPSSFLTISTPPNVRRSSTSDICENRKLLAPTHPSLPVPVDAGARRPSTSDLLRRARERKGPEAIGSKMGRSVSQGGIPRGGGRGGRRTSIAF